MIRCHYGYKCRYLNAHLDADGKLIRNEEKMAKVGPQSLNVFSHDLTLQLRSFKVWFFQGRRDSSMEHAGKLFYQCLTQVVFSFFFFSFFL